MAEIGGTAASMHREDSESFLVQVRVGEKNAQIKFLETMLLESHKMELEYQELYDGAREAVATFQVENNKLTGKLGFKEDELLKVLEELAKVRKELAEVKKKLTETKVENVRQNHAIDLALVEINNIPNRPTKEHFRKCIIHIQNVLGPLVKKK